MTRTVAAAHIDALRPLLDLSFRRGDAMAFPKRMKQELPLRFPEVTICDFGHIGDGGVHFNLVVSKDDARLATDEFGEVLRAWVRAVVVDEFGGSFSAEHAIGRKNQAIYDRDTPAKIRELAAA